MRTQRAINVDVNMDGAYSAPTLTERSGPWPTGNMAAPITTQVEWLMERRLRELQESPTEDCVEWPYCKNPNGYGIVSVNRRMKLVSRIAFACAWGPLPKGLCVLHSCDNPACFNPAHLFPGTMHMNALDAQSKGRTMSGTRNPSAKLTEAVVKDIRQLYAGGLTRTAIAAFVGVGRTQVSRIVDGHHWRRVS